MTALNQLLLAALLLFSPVAVFSKKQKEPCYKDFCLYDPGLGHEFGVPQVLKRRYGQHRVEHFLRVISETFEYLDEEVLKVGDTMENLPKQCRNHSPDCSVWALIGRCYDDRHQEYMQEHCAPACSACADNIYLTEDQRRVCNEFLRNATDHFQPGDMNNMFERILADPENKVYAASRPTTNGTADGGPWILVIDDFLTPDECEQAIALAGDWKDTQETETYSDGGIMNLNRFYCDHDHCDNAPISVLIRNKLSALTGVPAVHTDRMHILKYKLGEQLPSHHDFLEEDLETPHGPGSLQANIYLSEVKGGETNFPRISNTAVQTKKGRLVLWPNTLDDQPSHPDYRTYHESLAIKDGIKYGLNIGMFLRDYRNAYDAGCAGKLHYD